MTTTGKTKGKFEGRIGDGPILIADGAAGTLLQAAGLSSGQIPEAWNIEEPAKIEAMHRAYLDAGANIILTNSFGANRLKLERAHQGNEVARFNAAAARIARLAADGRGFVAGDIGPSGELMQPMGDLTAEAARQTYAEQAVVLADSGVDLFVVETMSDLHEAQAAIEGIQRVSSLPIVCTMSFDTRLHTMMGVTPEKMMETLWPLGLIAIGGNCGRSLEENLQVVSRLRTANRGATLWIKPNAGLPRMMGDEVMYDLGPEEFASYARKFVDAGARVIGGCCGSTPAHIAAVARALA